MTPRPPAPARRIVLAGAAAVLAVAGVTAITVAATSGPDLPTAPPVAATSSGTVTNSGTGTSSGGSSGGTSSGTAPAAAGTASTGTPAPSPSVVPALPRSRPTRLVVPALHVDTRDLVELGLSSSGALQVPVGPHPVGWFTGSPAPGQTGPAVLAGHVTWNGQRGTFFAIGTLHAGDLISVGRADGRTVRFRVYRVTTYPKSSFPTAEVYGNTPGPELRLITCAGDYDPHAAQHYPDNVVVFARAIR